MFRASHFLRLHLQQPAGARHEPRASAAVQVSHIESRYSCRLPVFWSTDLKLSMPKGPSTSGDCIERVSFSSEVLSRDSAHQSGSDPPSDQQGQDSDLYSPPSNHARPQCPTVVIPSDERIIRLGMSWTFSSSRGWQELDSHAWYEQMSERTLHLQEGRSGRSFFRVSGCHFFSSVPGLLGRDQDSE